MRISDWSSDVCSSDLNRAEADITAARARSQADLRRIRVATALAWIDAYYAQKRLEAMDVVLERLRRLPGAAVSAVAAGTGRPAQSLNIRQSIAELFEDRRRMLVAEAGKARAELARWTGDPDQIGRASCGEREGKNV